MSEIECLVFSNRYAELAHAIRVDNGVYVSGTLSVREDEPPKVLINRMEELVEDSRFRPELVSAQPTKKDMRSAKTDQRRETATVAESPKTVAMNTLEGNTRLFLRVPDMEGPLYQKARNLAEIFDGTFPVYFYNASTKEYAKTPIGVAISDYVYRQFCELLGEENAILK